jgi:hypothetical protein
VKAAVRNKGQSLIKISRNFPPTAACQILVTKDGTSNKAIDVGRLVAIVNNARLIVGSPSPIIPLTIPAKRKVPKMTITVECSNIFGWYDFENLLKKQESMVIDRVYKNAKMEDIERGKFVNTPNLLI